MAPGAGPSVRAGHRLTERGELRLLLQMESMPEAADFSVMEWIALVEAMIGNLKRAMIDTLGPPRDHAGLEVPQEHDLIIPKITPIRATRRKR